MNTKVDWQKISIYAFLFKLDLGLLCHIFKISMNHDSYEFFIPILSFPRSDFVLLETENDD